MTEQTDIFVEGKLKDEVTFSGLKDGVWTSLFGSGGGGPGLFLKDVIIINHHRYTINTTLPVICFPYIDESVNYMGWYVQTFTDYDPNPYEAIEMYHGEINNYDSPAEYYMGAFVLHHFNNMSPDFYYGVEAGNFHLVYLCFEDVEFVDRGIHNYW